MKAAIELASWDECTGCAACCAACSFDALSMHADNEGFLRPEIDCDTCITCGACVRACPMLGAGYAKREPDKVLACWDRSSEQREFATSGGVFGLLASGVLAEGGYVCGAVLGEDMAVRHVVTRDGDLMKRMKGSKYVQSDTADALAACAHLLKEGCAVLFVGTPCQVAAMRAIAPKGSEKRLYLVDVLCHGAPSPLFWKAYLEYREAEVRDEVIDARFRKKSPSWTVFSLELTFKTEHRLYEWCTVEDLYLRAFLGDYISRPCCHFCRYAGTERTSDITLADFWGYVSDSFKTRNTEQGISLVLLNSEKANELFAKASPRLVIVDKTLDEASAGNAPLRGPIAENPRRREFWEAFSRQGIEGVASDFLQPVRPSFKYKMSLLFNKYAFLVPRPMRLRLIELRQKLKG